MKLRLLAVAVAALTLSAGIASAQDTTSEKGKLSYAFGYEMGLDAAKLAAAGESLDINTLVKGLQDAYAKRQPSITEESLRPAMQAFQKRQQSRAAQAKAAFDKMASDNRTKSTSFLSQNRAKAGTQVLPSGVQYRILEAGRGAKPTQASEVTVEFLGPYAYGQRPTPVPAAQRSSVKVSQIEMPAMREVVMQMPAGSRWEVALPPDKAFGSDPRTGFPPNVAVVFDIKLVSVK